MAGQGSGGNVIAAICNVFFPGLGQLVQGRIMAALFFFIGVAACYAIGGTLIFFFMLVPAVIGHIWSIIDAARYKGG